MDDYSILFLYVLILQILSIVPLIIFRSSKTASIFTNIILLTGLSAGFSATVFYLLFGRIPLNGLVFFNIPENIFRFDSLALYFLLIIQLISIPTTIYGYSYLNHYVKKGKSVKNFLLFYIILIVSTQLDVVSNHSMIFLVSWELVSLSAYLGMIFEKEKKEVQTGSFYYIVVSHMIMFLLYIFFFILRKRTGSWYFSDFHITKDIGYEYILAFALSIMAFGLKAGFIPAHFWLPRAHPIAPTIISAFLSGIIIKMGIYGILRTFQFLQPVPAYFGWIVLIISLISAIFGVWYALAQHDLKKLLAYHSIENIGIIGIGIGLGFIGSAYNSIPIQMLGFGGALLHTLNHAIFKSLLFIGSGVIYQNLGTRNMELMGGLVKYGRTFFVMFLIGSVAISGVPPLNGFISEFIIYSGFFKTAEELKSYYPLLMLIFTVGLALVGGLAVACFTKINSIMFLGSERREVKSFKVTLFDYISLGILSTLCVVIGLFPKYFIRIIDKVLRNQFVPSDAPDVLLSINWTIISVVFGALIAGVSLFFGVKILIQKRYGRRINRAWGCGYDKINSKMQYSASSFADEINDISKVILNYEKKIEISDKLFQPRREFESESKDLIDYKIVIPFYRNLEKLASKIKIFNTSDIRISIVSLVVIIIIYGLAALIW